MASEAIQWDAYALRDGEAGGRDLRVSLFGTARRHRSAARVTLTMSSRTVRSGNALAMTERPWALLVRKRASARGFRGGIDLAGLVGADHRAMKGSLDLRQHPSHPDGRPSIARGKFRR